MLNIRPTADAPMIANERLTPGTRIYVTGCSFEVETAKFDGYGYMLGFVGSDETLYVDAGGSVQYDGNGEPDLRGDGKITSDEWAAKDDANRAALEAFAKEGVSA